MSSDHDSGGLVSFEAPRQRAVITPGRTPRWLRQWLDVGSGIRAAFFALMGCVLGESLLHCRADGLADLRILSD
jgi:hypothetical protein